MKEIINKILSYKINLNSKIKVKLTDYGEYIYRFKTNYYPVKLNSGYSCFTIWQFMEIFGNYISKYSMPIIEDLVFYISEKDVEEVNI